MKGNADVVDGGSEFTNKELSERESQVLLFLAQGHTNRSVAYILGISTRTVEVHRFRVMHKLGFRSISDLTLYAVRNKLLEP